MPVPSQPLNSACNSATLARPLCTLHPPPPETPSLSCCCRACASPINILSICNVCSSLWLQKSTLHLPESSPSSFSSPSPSLYLFLLLFWQLHIPCTHKYASLNGIHKAQRIYAALTSRQPRRRPNQCDREWIYLYILYSIYSCLDGGYIDRYIDIYMHVFIYIYTHIHIFAFLYNTSIVFSAANSPLLFFTLSPFCYCQFN